MVQRQQYAQKNKCFANVEDEKKDWFLYTICNKKLKKNQNMMNDPDLKSIIDLIYIFLMCRTLTQHTFVSYQRECHPEGL